MEIDTKDFTKSKTMRSLAICLIIVVMNIMGIGEAEVGKTIDTMHEMQGGKTENIKDILMLIGVGGAAYGRVVADKPLGRKKKGAGNEEAD